MGGLYLGLFKFRNTDDFFTKKEEVSTTEAKSIVTDKELKKLLEPYKKIAWYPVVKKEKGKRNASKFSGSPVLLDSEN